MLEESIGYLKRMILFYPISSQLFHHNVLSRVILVPLANYTIKNIHNFCNILLQLHIFFFFPIMPNAKNIYSLVSAKSYEKDSYLSWCVCCSAFVANAVVLGVDLSFGEIVGPIMNDFSSSESDTAWIGSIHSSIQFFSASVASLLAEMYGFGTVIFIGILTSTVGFLMSDTCTSVQCLAIYYGVVAGFGLGMIYTPGSISCSFHFIEHRSLATGIAVTGSGVGVTLISKAMNMIMENGYGWKGCVKLFTILTPLCGFLAILNCVLPLENEKEVDEKNGSFEAEVKGGIFAKGPEG